MATWPWWWASFTKGAGVRVEVTSGQARAGQAFARAKEIARERHCAVVDVQPLPDAFTYDMK
jgi:hypothetical protein